MRRVMREDVINYINAGWIILFFSCTLVAKSVVRSGNESRRNYVHAHNYYFYRYCIFFIINEYAHYAEHAHMHARKCVERVLHVHTYTSRWIVAARGGRRKSKVAHF